MRQKSRFSLRPATLVAVLILLAIGALGGCLEEQDFGAAPTGCSALGITSGTITEWQESGSIFYFDDYTCINTGIEASWSLNTETRGWFYGYNISTEVAHVTGITDIFEIIDASFHSYSDWSIGPVDIGDFVLFHNVNSGYYAAFRIDNINGCGASYCLDVTWYLQENGTSNFTQ